MYLFAKKDDYIFEIIHDLKAPVASIDIALENAERDEFLDEIYKINKHNLNYIENLMMGFSLTHGRYCPKFEIINLVKIVKEELKVLNFLIENRGLHVILSLDKIDEGYIVSDKYLVRQIVLNLLANAVKYTPVGGNIGIIFEKRAGYIKVCFSNKYDSSIKDRCSTKMGLEIVKRKLKAVRGKLKIEKNKDSICFNICFECK